MSVDLTSLGVGTVVECRRSAVNFGEFIIENLLFLSYRGEYWHLERRGSPGEKMVTIVTVLHLNYIRYAQQPPVNLKRFSPLKFTGQKHGLLGDNHANIYKQ